MALKGLKVVELVGLAPAPFCGMILSDFGATVIRVDRVNRGMEATEPFRRGKLSIALDLKHDDGRAALKALCRKADILIEPFRPGVMERLGLGPADLMAENERLIYTRMSGFGQTGPLSRRAGHDINYCAVSGVLSALGPKEPAKPAPPANILADFAGGGLTGAFGILAAVVERQSSGKGQVIDANLAEGAAYVASAMFMTRDSEKIISQLAWPNMSQRGANMLDGGAPFYQVYRTKDGKYMSVGSLEQQFYSDFLNGLGLDARKYDQSSISDWDQHEHDFQQVFMTKTQSEWMAIFEPLDCCVIPVVDIDKAYEFPHNRERNSFMSNRCPRPAPLLERTPGTPNLQEPEFGQHTQQILTELGYTADQIRDLVRNKVVFTDSARSNL